MNSFAVDLLNLQRPKVGGGCCAVTVEISTGVETSAGDAGIRIVRADEDTEVGGVYAIIVVDVSNFV